MNFGFMKRVLESLGVLGLTGNLALKFSEASNGVL
jgi:hypothetical protein